MGEVSATSDTAPTITADVVDGRAVLVVPDTVEDGEHTYTVTHRSSGGIAGSASAPMAISVHRQGGAGPVTAEAEQASVEVWDEQVLHVSGLDPGERVLLYLHSDPVYLGSATADAQRTVEFIFACPAGQHPESTVSRCAAPAGSSPLGWTSPRSRIRAGARTTLAWGTDEPGGDSGGSGNGTTTGGGSGSGALPGDITTGGQTSSGTTPKDGSGSDSSAAAPGNGTGARSELAASGAESALVVTSAASLVLAWWGVVLVGRSRVRVRGGKKS